MTLAAVEKLLAGVTPRQFVAVGLTDGERRGMTALLNLAPELLAVAKAFEVYRDGGFHYDEAADVEAKIHEAFDALERKLAELK